MTEADNELTVEQIAARLGIKDLNTVRRWLHGGALRGYRLSTKTGWRVKESDLEAFLQSHYNKPQAASKETE